MKPIHAVIIGGTVLGIYLLLKKQSEKDKSKKAKSSKSNINKSFPVTKFEIPQVSIKQDGSICEFNKDDVHQKSYESCMADKLLSEQVNSQHGAYWLNDFVDRPPIENWD